MVFFRRLGLGKPYYIPLAQSDFIFAAICKEFGALGALAIILMYLILLYRGLKVAISPKMIILDLLQSGLHL